MGFLMLPELDSALVFFYPHTSCKRPCLSILIILLEKILHFSSLLLRAYWASRSNVTSDWSISSHHLIILSIPGSIAPNETGFLFSILLGMPYFYRGKYLAGGEEVHQPPNRGDSIVRNTFVWIKILRISMIFSYKTDKLAICLD